MKKIFIDAVAIRGGGGVTVLANLLAGFYDVAPSEELIVFGSSLTKQALEQSSPQKYRQGYRIIRVPGVTNYFLRLLWQQVTLPLLCLLRGAGRMLSVCNVGAVLPTVPQYVYYHNALHFPTGQQIAHYRTRVRFKLQWFLIAWSLRRSCGVITQTEVIARELNRLAKVPKNQITVIPPGVPRILSREEGVTANVDAIAVAARPSLLYVAHPAPHKNVECLLRAVALLRWQIPKVQLVLTMDLDALEGTRMSGNNQSEYRLDLIRYLQLVDELNLGENIYWAGVLSPQAVQAFIRACKVFCFPSLVESFPQPLTEAMASGTPIVVADLPYAREICGEGALYADPHRPEAWSECIGRVLRDKALRAKVGQAGLERSYRYSYARAAREILDLIKGGDVPAPITT